MTSFDDLTDDFTTLDRGAKWIAYPYIIGDGTSLYINNTEARSRSFALYGNPVMMRITDGSDPNSQCYLDVTTTDVDYTSPDYVRCAIYKSVSGSPLGDGVPCLAVQYAPNTGTPGFVNIPWDPVAHAWIKIEQNPMDNLVYFAASIDGASWSNLYTSASAARPLTQCSATIEADAIAGGVPDTSFGIALSHISLSDAGDETIGTDEAHPLDSTWTIDKRAYLDTGGGVVIEQASLETAADYDLANASVTVHFASTDGGSNIFIGSRTDTEPYLRYQATGTIGYIQYRGGGSTNYAYLTAPHPTYVRFSTDAAGIATIAVSADGTTWYRALVSTTPVTITDGYLHIETGYSSDTSSTKVASIEHIPPGAYADGAWPGGGGGGGDGGGGDYPEPPYDDSGDDTWTPDPSYTAPSSPAAEKECATLLQLVQDFSAAVRRAVRITGPTSVEVVNPEAPLPAGFTNARAREMYASTTLNQKAGDAVLSLLKGSLTLEGSATIITDDVRVVLSSWKIPNHLPVYNVNPAKVTRVAYTFTPEHFSASLNFHFNDVPLRVRRT